MLADGGYQGTGLLIPPRRRPGQTELPPWKERDNAAGRRVRARVEHTFAAMKTWTILRDCRRRGHGVYWATTGVAHLRNLALTSQPDGKAAEPPTRNDLRDSDRSS